MKYKAIRYFIDLRDHGYEYNVGDTYPREGYEVCCGRLAELLSSNNKLGTPVIVEVPEEEEKKPARKTRKKQ